MAILMWIVFGFVIGLVARALMPGKQPMGALWTTLIGIGGSLLGGYAGALLTHHKPQEYSPAGIIGSLLGAMGLLFLFGLANRQTRTPA